jgi:hypothetical protein
MSVVFSLIYYQHPAENPSPMLGFPQPGDWAAQRAW